LFLVLVPPDPRCHEDEAGQANEVPEDVHLVSVELVFVCIYEKFGPFKKTKKLTKEKKADWSTYIHM
jgi:hypothetical protein